MQRQEVEITDQTELSIVLIEDMAQIGEVVVVGYGSRKKETITSAVSNIKSEEILTTTHSSLAQALQGKIPGLQIRQTRESREILIPGSMSGVLEPHFM